jgi:hypothetical protein
MQACMFLLSYEEQKIINFCNENLRCFVKDAAITLF